MKKTKELTYRGSLVFYSSLSNDENRDSMGRSTDNKKYQSHVLIKHGHVAMTTVCVTTRMTG